jgi:hypothetical protein
MPTRYSYFLLFALLLAAPFAFGGDDFKPIAPDELAMKDNPKQPGAHAMILDWTDTEDDANENSQHYFRIKIFTEEGKKFADIEIPYFKGGMNISGIQARTIHPDGSIVPFTGKVYDKMVVKSKNLKFQAKTFSMPDVQPGSIIEYKYKRSWEGYGSTSWDLKHELYIKHAAFTLKPAEIIGLGFAWVGSGISGKDAVQKKGSSYTLELHDVPAFDVERYAPPEHQLKPHIDFFYSRADLNNEDNFWKKIGQDQYHEIEDFIGHRGGIRDAAAGLVAPGDTNDVKLRKLYAKVQELKNLTYTREKTEQESKREKLKDINNSEDVLKRGYGYHSDLNRLYAALVRAAGMDASIILTSQRDRVFFNKALLDASQLNGEIVLVKADGKDFFLDPGTPMCPFGLLPWKNTGVRAYQVNKEGGNFISTPQPQSNGAVTRRSASLKMDNGAIKGTVQVMYLNQEALHWRLSEITSDEAELRTDLENELKQLLPGGSTVKLTDLQNVKNQNQPLSVSYDVELPFMGSNVGSRLMMPVEVFQSNNRNPFVHEKRVYPIYFDYPYQELDEVTIEMPKEFAVENLPQPKKNQTDFAYYDANWAQVGNKLMMTRRFAMQGLLLPTTIYPKVRSFYEEVSNADQESVVLRAQK